MQHEHLYIYIVGYVVGATPPPATLELLLAGPAEHDFASAERLLSGLSGERALTVPAGLPCSVAAVLAQLLQPRPGP